MASGVCWSLFSEFRDSEGEHVSKTKVGNAQGMPSKDCLLVSTCMHVHMHAHPQEHPHMCTHTYTKKAAEDNYTLNSRSTELGSPQPREHKEPVSPLCCSVGRGLGRPTLSVTRRGKPTP